MSAPITSNTAIASTQQQRSLLLKAGLPIVPGTSEPISSYSHLEEQLERAQLLVREGSQPRLTSPVWLKAPRQKSREISSVDALYVTYANASSLSLGQDIVVERFFHSAFQINIQFQTIHGDHSSVSCHVSDLRNDGDKVSEQVLSSLRLGIGAMDQLIKVAFQASALMTMEGPVTVKFLFDEEEERTYLLKVKNEIHRESATAEGVESQKRDVTEKVVSSPVPDYLGQWLLREKIKSDDQADAWNKVLRLSLGKQAELQHHLLRMPQNCLDQILAFKESAACQLDLRDTLADLLLPVIRGRLDQTFRDTSRRLRRK